MKRATIIILLALGCLSPKAQIPQPDPDTTAKHFLIVASISNLQEISSGQLAVQKALRHEVKAFGAMMLKDHQEAEIKLLQLAKTCGYNLSPPATGGIKPDLNLEMPPVSFDKLYVHSMVVNHSNTVQTFENYATTGKDPAVKAFAKQMLPTLKHHLEAIKAIEKQLISN